jgi:hypothetical protein
MPMINKTNKLTEYFDVFSETVLIQSENLLKKTIVTALRAGITPERLSKISNISINRINKLKSYCL